MTTLNEEMEETRYLRFTLRHKLEKTNVYLVCNREGSPLGIVRWFGRWRQYCFYPEPGTIYNPECLFDIMEFIRKQMAERKNGIKV